jgi:hypothetical protein
MMATTSNCETCNYFGLEHSEYGHCYMFKTEPEGVCGKHTDPWFLPAMPKGITEVLELLSKTEQLPPLPDNAEITAR